ncbi:MAG: hypothetical protein ACTSV1_00865 [Alphaproteobacteria bacterium]
MGPQKKEHSSMALMDGMFQWLLTPPEKKPGGETVKNSDAFIPAHLAEPAGLTILVCGFEGKRGRELSERLVGFLSRKSGVVVKQLNKTLKLNGRGTLVEKYLAAAEAGRKWLVGTEADILLWGDIGDQEDSTINMRLLCAIADADKQPGSVGIGDILELPYEFSEQLEELVFAAIVAAVAPRKTASRGKLTELLSEAAGRLDAYVDTPPAGLDPQCQSSVMASLGNVMASMWRLKDDGVFLDRAIQAYRAGLSESFDRSRPMPWALAQNHLAAALQAQAKRDSNPEALLAAADCYRGVAAALGSQQHTNDWALAHVHLGDVLVRLANYDDRIARLQEADEVYKRALLVFTRQTMPGPWSELLNQIGVVMMTIGENVAGTEALQRSAACFRQALEVRRREVAPLLWAQTANNLGAATFALYRREPNVALLHEAAACFEGAAQVYSQHGRTTTADIAISNLDRVRETEAAAT